MKKNIITLIALLTLFVPVWAQQVRKVTGTVIDAKTNEPVIGVTIVLKGTSKGTITDFDGNYSLEIPGKGDEVLQYRFIGYTDKEEVVQGRSRIDVILSESTQQLEDVVVVGYGIQRKESVVGAIATIDNKTLVSMPVSNISQSIAGKLSGVQVVQTSGEIGDDVANIYIRGMATWGDASPLYVVDGIVRSEFAKIDPNEIESINILKDASATAVFGVKGANGVIIITTKRGALGKPKVSITAQTAITEPINIPQPLGAYDAMSLQYLVDYGEASVRTPQAKGGTVGYDLALWRTGASPWTHSDVDWADVVMKDFSTQQQYNINVSGGTKTVKYFVSGGYLNQNGFYKNDDLTGYTRFNFRSNIDAEVSKNLSASLSVGSRVENLTSPHSTIDGSWNVYHDAFANNGRTHPVFNPDGSYSGNGDNIVKRLESSGIYKNVTSTLETSLSLNHKLDFIIKGLSAKGQVAFDTRGEVGRAWKQSVAEYLFDPATNTYSMSGENRPLSYDGVKRNNNWYKLYYEVGLNYNRTFNDHTFSGLLLANRSLRIVDNKQDYADQGLVGRITYDYNRRYFAEMNVGYNGSENFPEGSRYGIFPAFAAGWLISEEGFMKNAAISQVLTKLKLRGSIGWVGNDKLKINNVEKRFLYLQSYTNGGGYTFGTGNNSFSGIRMGDIANFDVSWEVARKQNIGFESDLWKGLISLNVDYFYEYRNKILTDVSPIMPDYVGAAFMPANVGETQNQGFEVELKHTKKISNDFSYYVNGKFTFNRNKILKKADPEGLLPYQKEEGYAIGTPKMWNNIGYFTSYEDIATSPSQLSYHGGLNSNIVVFPGDLKFEDFNNDGVINEADAYRQGYGDVPEIQYGVTLGGNWKAFDFSVLIQGSTHALFMKQWDIMWAFSNNANVFDKHNYYWAPEIGDNAQYVRFHGNKWVNNERYHSTYEAGSGTYVRLKNIEFGDAVPSDLTRKIGMSSARIYFSSNNAYMWAVEKYLDPDNRDIRGGKMPPTRAFNVGLNINF